MTPQLIDFAKRYCRLLNIFNGFVSVAPLRFRPAFIFWLGRLFSPFNVYADKITRSFRLVLPTHCAEEIWNNWRDSHLRFSLDLLNYRKFDAAWLKNEVTCTDTSALQALRQFGGLLLTYHTHHQNTMCCVFGLSGMKVSAVAASPNDSPLFAYLGKWVKRVNADSAIHFNGGRYMFTDNLRGLLKNTRQCLVNGEVVVSLCDFHQPKTEALASGTLFDRYITPPTGVIEIAVKHQVPIFLALFAPEGEKHHLHITKLAETGNVEAVVHQYFSFLESNIRANPACWQGWEWFEDLPETLQAPI